MTAYEHGNRVEWRSDGAVYTARVRRCGRDRRGAYVEICLEFDNSVRRASTSQLRPLTPEGALMPAKPKPKLGRPTRRGGAANNKVTVRLTDDEHARYSTEAGDQGLADWMRDSCEERIERERRRAGR